MIGNIAKRWRSLSGENNWRNLLDPLDIDLRKCILHYGDMAQVSYDTFNDEKASKYAGDSRYSMEDLFSRVGLAIANPYKYKTTKYLYATSQVPVSESFILKSMSREAWCKESNWIGYVAVATDEGKAALGRRDIVISWRGTIQAFEWIDDFDFPLVSASKLFGKSCNAQVHQGWLSIYTSDDPRSPFNTTCARQQVLLEVERLVEEFKEEEISITITGHSLGAALGTLNAADIVTSGINQRDHPSQPCPVTGFFFACPHVGDSSFCQMLQAMKDLHILRVRNAPDLIPYYPPLGYSDVGEELVIDTRKSKYLKSLPDFSRVHGLEAYLHGVAGTQGSRGEFHLEVKRDIALVNKWLDALKEEYLVPKSWWCVKNKGMVQQDDGSWLLEDHEKDKP
ncbi:phospholipase A1-IIgamma [Tripterygium wilfordii]|uniref:Phospholipase A1 n=1 Tax=Tripterygium wilfordii TaxID=458696 RepID=A0A7J7DVC8_TRIWF|nr:phospholipase A1-IIgamma-like [Tripterygium wilfordii]KAF5750114.1 phospholipase A1-IIgamma [Tripterygium wilfordii]